MRSFMIYLKFSGSIKNPKLIRKLEEEFTDIAQISGWEHELVSENFHTMTSRPRKNVPAKEDVYDLDENEGEEILSLSSSEVFLDGIVLRIDRETDPVKLTFDRKGRLATISFCTSDTAGFNNKLTIKKYEFLYHPYIRIYTPNAEKHKQIIKILDYVKKKYISDLEVIDTSFFWNNRDEEELKVKFWKAANNRKFTY